ncbi:hypothetical protein [Streptomyces sp. cg35]|uniref:hypothetical protein n=1 Tax=Streptomyces sp. cg35 TaxID=3421650 RepID=UPI003D17E974
MSESINEGDQVVRRGGSRTPRIVIGVALLVIAAGAGGFGAGRAMAPKSDQSAAGACSEPKGAVDRLVDEENGADTNEDPAEKSRRASTLVNLVLQNPSCFSAELRARAQTAKDQQAANADSAALSEAASRAAECADPNRLTSVC